MATPIFNQASIFHLHQLEANYRRRTGESHRLSMEDSCYDLLSKSSQSSDIVIQKYYRRFANQLDPDLADELSARGIAQPNILTPVSGA